MRSFKLGFIVILLGIASLLDVHESLSMDNTKDYYLMNENLSKHHYFMETSQGTIAIGDTKPCFIKDED